MLSSASVVASIPSPPISSFPLGPLTIHFYALCILTGIIIAAFMTNHRLTKRGAEPWVVIDICLIAVPLAIIGARLFHVFTHWSFYFDQGRDWWNPFVKDAIWNVWDGGIAIFGALIGGAIGAWLGCKWTGIRFWSFADALAPGLLLAQAIGRFGNWFNQELFGTPTDLPWGLQIDYPNPAWPTGLPEGTLFHPTFLYEVIWNTLGVIFLLWVGKRFTLQWGRLFALYLVWYSAGRIVWENIRIDPSEVFFGLRTNVWAAIFGVIVGIVIFFVQKRRHPGLEPSPYQRGRERSGGANVQSQNTEDFVDVSAPPTSDVLADAATSAVASK
ncbi:MAG: prolipoprotein diacylglyceryl transferase [Microbacterium sp. SCN 70-27]|uniref:prolipoprotein diacylglyceryl transferase n=1 Tax=unclassified Microbacterium TaxID=2609290 RepID=UPI00086C8822|nr:MULTISPECIES: prolipoprotein diacylglyceryl transferase [unclassified Microbacterium]MBN9225032.1 prolipoprotein diacylglyceryl transferase [Microbacterium sp.]ODT26129.1 MAG: prolipoprotein diacylglyceryl transferase [Microbacterium sp. SCN 70-27]